MSTNTVTFHRVLRTTPEKMVDYWRMSAIGGVLSGTIGVQGHYANGLAALFIACGQDAACVAALPSMAAWRLRSVRNCASGSLPTAAA